jgi:conjugal transfer mating pair stabilization protein TraG
MAFLIAMGGFGIGLIGKYLMLLAWMMLWMPALAIVNLYTVSSTASAMQAILQTSSFDVGGTGVSFEMLKQMGPALEQAIGVAGLMASSIPAICLFLVSGATIAASGIAGRMNGSDAINEKIASPDVISPSAGVQTTPYATSDFDKGLRINGSENQRGNISIGSQLNETVQSSRAISEGSSQAFSKQLTSTLGRSLDNSKTIGEAADVGHSLQSSLGLEKNAAFQQQYNSLRSQGYSSNNIDAAIASVALNGGVNGNLGAKAGVGVDGVPGGNASVGGGVALTGGATASKTDQTTRSDGSAYADTLSAVKSSGLGETVKSALQRTDGTTMAKNFQSADRSSLSKSDQESLSQSAQKTISDQSAYQKVSGFAKSYGYAEDMKLDSLAGKVINEGRDNAVVSDAMNKYGPQFQENQKMFGSTMLDPRRANTAAALYTLANNHDFEALTGAKVDYDKNANLHAPDVGNLKDKAAGAGHSVDVGAFNSRFKQEKTDTLAQAQIGQKNVRNNDIVQNDGEVYAKQALNPAADKAADRIRNTDKEVTDKGESSFGIFAAASNGVGTLLGTRASREDYMHEGQQLGLNEAQADVFATARVGGLSDNSRESWDQYAASTNMDQSLSNGMYKQLIEAGLHDNGSGAHLSDILTLNQRDNVGADLTSASAIPREAPVSSAPGASNHTNLAQPAHQTASRTGQVENRDGDRQPHRAEAHAPLNPISHPVNPAPVYQQVNQVHPGDVVRLDRQGPIHRDLPAADHQPITHPVNPVPAFQQVSQAHPGDVEHLDRQGPIHHDLPAADYQPLNQPHMAESNSHQYQPSNYSGASPAEYPETNQPQTPEPPPFNHMPSMASARHSANPMEPALDQISRENSDAMTGVLNVNQTDHDPHSLVSTRTRT